MLNYKSATVFCIISLILIAFAGLYDKISLWLFLIPIGIYLTMIFYGASNIRSDFFMRVASGGDTTFAEVALTFDDGPSPETTPAILDVLKKNGITAAFFCIGEKAVEHPELLQRIADEGHIIGNHSYSHHFFFDFLSHDNMVREIRNTNKAIEKIIRKRVHLFRPPYGVTTPVLAKAVKKAKMTPVGWTLRSMDTVTSSSSKLVNKITKNLRPGDVILLHDTETVTVESLQKIIDSINQKDLNIVPVDTLLNINAYV